MVVIKYCVSRDTGSNEQRDELKRLCVTVVGHLPIGQRWEKTKKKTDAHFILHAHDEKQVETTLHTRDQFVPDPPCKMHIHFVFVADAGDNIFTNTASEWATKTRFIEGASVNASLVAMTNGQPSTNIIQLKRGIDVAVKKLDASYRLARDFERVGVIALKSGVKTPQRLAERIVQPSVLYDHAARLKLGLYAPNHETAWSGVAQHMSLQELEKSDCNLVFAVFGNEHFKEAKTLFETHQLLNERLMFIVYFDYKDKFTNYDNWLSSVGHRFITVDSNHTVPVDDIIKRALEKMKWRNFEYGLSDFQSRSGTKESIDELNTHLALLRVNNDSVAQQLANPAR